MRFILAVELWQFPSCVVFSQHTSRHRRRLQHRRRPLRFWAIGGCRREPLSASTNARAASALRIMFLSPTADATTDIHQSRRDSARPLDRYALLSLGSPFFITSDADATRPAEPNLIDQKVEDKNSYRGQMCVARDLLRLRAIVGFLILFGRTEIWQSGVHRKLCILSARGHDLTSEFHISYENIDSSG